MAESLDLRLATAKTFAPYLGSVFTSHDPPATLLLSDVASLPSDANAPRHDPFALTFIGDAGVTQATLDLDHPVLGHLELFLVPTGYAPDGKLVYEAVFN